MFSHEKTELSQFLFVHFPTKCLQNNQKTLMKTTFSDRFFWLACFRTQFLYYLSLSQSNMKITSLATFSKIELSQCYIKFLGRFQQEDTLHFQKTVIYNRSELFIQQNCGVLSQGHRCEPLYQGHRCRAQSPLELIEPHCTCDQKPLNPSQPVS